MAKILFLILTMLISIVLIDADFSPAHVWALGFAGGVVGEWLDVYYINKMKGGIK